MCRALYRSDIPRVSVSIYLGYRLWGRGMPWAWMWGTDVVKPYTRIEVKYHSVHSSFSKVAPAVGRRAPVGGGARPHRASNPRPSDTKSGAEGSMFHVSNTWIWWAVDTRIQNRVNSIHSILARRRTIHEKTNDTGYIAQSNQYMTIHEVGGVSCPINPNGGRLAIH